MHKQIIFQEVRLHGKNTKLKKIMELHQKHHDMSMEMAFTTKPEDVRSLRAKMGWITRRIKLIINSPEPI